MNIETKNDLIEEILTAWKDRIGDDYPGYRGHVYRKRSQTMGSTGFS